MTFSLIFFLLYQPYIGHKITGMASHQAHYKVINKLPFSFSDIILLAPEISIQAPFL